jgi:hypothetical protein
VNPRESGTEHPTYREGGFGTSDPALAVSLPEHPNQDGPERPVLLAVDQ